MGTHWKPLNTSKTLARAARVVGWGGGVEAVVRAVGGGGGLGTLEAVRAVGTLNPKP